MQMDQILSEIECTPIPLLEIMPSGVPQKLCASGVSEDTQLRAALVELKTTLECYTRQTMNTDATPLIQTAVAFIKKNQLLLNKVYLRRNKFNRRQKQAEY